MASPALAFAALVGGAVVLDYGVKNAKTAFSGNPAASTSAGTTAAVGSAQGVSGNAQSVMSYLTANGFTPVAAAGITGNLQQESGINPAQSGGGLAQWIGARWTALVSFASGKGLSPNSMQAQLEYLVNELHTQYPSTVTQLNAATTPAQAATIVSTQYERPSLPMLQNRIDYAQSAYAGYKG